MLFISQSTILKAVITYYHFILYEYLIKTDEDLKVPSGDFSLKNDEL